MFVGFNILYFTMQVLGMKGMPRRYYDYLPEFTTLNLAATVGTWILAVGLVLMLVNLFRGLLQGSAVRRQPLGRRDPGVEVPSPPPTENFDEEPVVTHGPYDFKGAVIP